MLLIWNIKNEGNLKYEIFQELYYLDLVNNEKILVN